MSWSERKVKILATVKRAAPGWARQLYRRSVGLQARQRWATSTMLEPLDWRRTKAFAMRTDQHGWIRVNLKGRERLGIVDPNRYEETCSDIEALLSSLRTVDGAALVQRVARASSTVDEALRSPLPDLIVYWTPKAHERNVRLRGGQDMPPPFAPQFNGQHAETGFCFSSGPISALLPEGLNGIELGSKVTELLLRSA